MRVLKLRNHIPIASPARREPADGTEVPLRVSLGFEPAWFRDRCEVHFTERWHRDPEYRYRTLSTMKETLIRSFPEFAQWRQDDSDDLATISGVFGAFPIPHAFGMPLIYAEDRWPMLDPAARLSSEEVEKLDAKAVLGSAPVEDLFKQMDIIERRWGKIHGYLNWQGVLNTAFNLRGQEIFLDLVDRPELAHRLFEVITEVMITLARSVQRRQRASGFPIDQLSVSNCVMNMISPHDYDSHLRHYDARIADSFKRFGVHTCNWNVTPYIDALSELPKLGYLDMGMMSDLRAVRDRFPHAYRAVIYSAVRLREESLETIRRDMTRIRAELGPCDVVLADLQSSTSDERVREVIRICAKVAEAEHEGQAM